MYVCMYECSCLHVASGPECRNGGPELSLSSSFLSSQRLFGYGPWGGLTIISTAYMSEFPLQQRDTLEMGMGKSLHVSEFLKRRLLK